jgi:hypothetical protein
MSDVLQDAVTTEFLEQEWSKATAYRKREIARSISDFMDDHPNCDMADYWPARDTADDGDDFDDDDDDDDFLSDQVSDLKRRVSHLERQVAKKS